MTITLPSELSQWVQEQLASGKYDSPSELFAHLVRAEQRRRLREQIDDRLHRSLDSGEATPVTESTWENVRAEGRKRIDEKRTRRSP